MLYPIQIIVLDGTGRVLDTEGEGEKVYVLKVGSHAYSPLTVPAVDSLKTAKSEQEE